MITMHHLTTIEDVIGEGKRMNNALQVGNFSRPMLERGTEIYSFRIDHGESVANIAVDQGIVTNIVGPNNARIDSRLLEEIRNKVSEFAVIREGHTYGGERMTG